MLSQTKKKESSVPHTKRKNASESEREFREKKESFFFCFIVKSEQLKKLLIFSDTMPGISKPQICGLGQPLLDITATVGEGTVQ